MKLTLLIPLIILSSCTIDWNNEKDAKIAKLEGEVIELKESKLALLNSTKALTFSGNICDIRLNECLLKKGETASKWAKDFGSGFLLSQTDDETTVSYSGRIVKTWSHTPPENIPFVWDEACVDFFEAMDMVSPEYRNKNPNWKQEEWNKFDTNSKRNCMKEYFGKNILVNRLTDRFFEIRKIYYEGWDTGIYDRESGNLQDIPSIGEPRIEVTNTGIQIKVYYDYGDDRGKIDNLYFYNSNFDILLSQTYLN